MDETTARWALPLLAAGQAQKEMTHNEALAAIDLLLQPSVAAIGLDAPPAAPAEGQCWVVGRAPVGDWAGRAGAVAGWTGGGWRFADPREGMAVWSLADGMVARRMAGGWTVGALAGAALSVDGVQVVGPRRPAIPDPAGGTTVDAEARAGVAAILAALRAHGLVAG